MERSNEAGSDKSGLVGAVVLFTMPISVSSQEYPTRPITVVVGVAPGGITDVSTRIYVEALSKGLGQKIVVENRPTGGGTVAAIATSK